MVTTMSKRGRDTNYYVGGVYTPSGKAWVVVPGSGERLFVVSGLSRVGPGKVHVASLATGTRIYAEGGGSALLDPGRLYGRRGRKGRGKLDRDAARVMVRRSSSVSRLLRHGGFEATLDMDEAGWVHRSEVARVLGYSDAEIDEILLYNNKGRLEAFGDRIRAVQGHSPGGVPVTLEGLEASWERIHPEGLLYHGTRRGAAEAIAEGGLNPGGRTHVHLSLSIEGVATTAGRGEVVVAIDPARLEELGISIFMAPNGVVLARAVPAEAIDSIRYAR